VPGAQGRLDVIATPIGNLEDLSARARATLAQADLVAAEDTRHTAQLLAAIGVSRTLVSLHEHNERSRVAQLLAALQQGRHIALVSDAGTPLLSDPGFALVRAAAAAGVEVRAIPGPCALIAALSVAALPTDRFVFEGFLPAHARERRAAIARLAREARTLVFFEAPHRILATLEDLAALFGSQRQAAIARELTKVHESVYRGSLAELIDAARADANIARGEITVVVAGTAPAQASAADQELLVRALELLLKELPPARAAAIAAQLTGATRREAYALALRLHRSASPAPTRSKRPADH
jgi:16S rRNA (cytidine1402-2'-O)-methyltransferase